MEQPYDYEELIHQDEIATVSCGTTAGPMKIEFYKIWSPLGYERVVQLFDVGFYDNTHLFRMVPGFLVQFGITYNDALRHYGAHTIPDDPQFDPPIPFTAGMLSFAGSGPNSRTSQIFIAFTKGAFGREKWETPLGRVTEGMENVYNFYSGYGDMPDYGNGPIQAKIHSGPEYIETDFPKLDRITTCTVQRVQPKQDNPLDQREEEQHVPKIGLQKQTGKTKQKRKTKSQLHSQRDVGKEQHNQKSGHGLDGMASLRKPHHYSDEHGASQHVDKNSPMEKRILNKVAHVHHGNVQPEEANHQEQQHLHHHHHHVTIQQDGHDPLKIKVPNETGSMQEGVTVFSWELLSVCLFMFVSVLLLWLNFVCRGGSKKARKTQ